MALPADRRVGAKMFTDHRGPAEELANRLRIRIRTLLAERGADLAHAAQAAE